MWLPHRAVFSETLNNSKDLNITYADYGESVSSSTDAEGPIDKIPFSSYCLSPQRVSKLTDISSFTVSIALWKHMFMLQGGAYVMKRHKTSIDVHLREKVVALIKELPVPVSIADCIRQYVYFVSTSLQCWNRYHLDAVFWDTQNNCSLYRLFHHIIWSPNGRIDRVRTARNLLKSPRLTDVEKYRLLCTYCLKDELERMWPSLISNDGIDLVNESYYPLIHYWNCYFANKLDQIRCAENQTVDSFMFENTKVDNWPAKEYFFNRFTPEEQIRNVILFIDQNDAKYQKMFLRKLDNTQRTQVYTSCAVKIISNYIAQPEFNELDIRSTWFEIRDLVTYEDFVAIYKCLLSSRLVGDTLLEYIWSSASYDLKSHLLNHNNHEVVGCALRVWVKKNENDFFFKMLSKSSANTKRYITMESFYIQCCVDLIRDDKFPLLDRLLEFCFVKPEEAKQFKRDLVQEEFFIRLCEKLITVDKLKVLDEVLNALLFNDHEEITKFKQNLSKREFFDVHCEKLVIDSKFQTFSTLLNSFVGAELEQSKFKQSLLSKSNSIKYYCLNCHLDGKKGCSRVNTLLASLLPSSPDFIIDYKKNLLMSSNGIDWWAARINSKIDLNPVFTNCLPTPELVAEFKERVIFSPIAVDRFRRWIISCFITEFNVCVNRYITSNQDKITLKKRIIGNPVDLMCDFFKSSANAKRTNWVELEVWWRQEEPSSNMKSTLPLDEIFDTLLKDCIYLRYDPAHRISYCKLRYDIRFDSLNWFLEWYFVLPSEVLKYKMRRINAYREIDAINTLVKKRNTTFLEIVLNWFFEGNSQCMAEFKTKKKGEKIINAIP